ncbi:MAG: hypothetical protein Q8M22_00790 [Actinomycetota bacterium]|nr:hypothetical protein [Actinomycetota bacterium]
MLVSEFTDHVPGWRIIAEPAALDAAPWPAGSHVVRISSDDAYVIGSVEPTVPPDPHAIVTPELGFSMAAVLDVAALAEQHIEWELPADRPALAQGQIAGVPAKLVLHADGSTQLLVACAARHELEGRLA